jgi:hypothetical protein
MKGGDWLKGKVFMPDTNAKPYKKNNDASVDVTKKTRKLKRITPFTPKWHELAYQLLLGYAPDVLPCSHCGGPVLRGYCCNRCGSGDP